MILHPYLAGLISTTVPELLDRWSFHDSISPLTPMSGKSGLEDNTKDGGITDLRLNPGDIIHRDFQDVMRSDLILANLNLWGSPRPMLGTWPELGWAWEHKKPVIAISTPGDSNYDLVRSHPFVRAFVAHYFDTVEEAAEFIESYYVRP